MNLHKKTLEKLRLLINEETEYRSGPKLVAFFNELGFRDSYGQGFPSRWIYTDSRLAEINGTPELDKCIRNLFAPVNFIDRINELDDLIKEFNKFLSFDKWQVIRKEADITFKRIDKPNLNNVSEENREDEFLKKEFDEISLDKIGVEGVVINILKYRFEEIKKCLNIEASLAVVFLAGSSLEGILFGMASKYPNQFNRSSVAPKDKEGKVKKFYEWSLNNYIDVAYDIGLLMEDVKKFSHSLRDFRNYIHPYIQLNSKFNPDKHTALICWQVLKAAIYQITKNKINL